MRNCTLVFLLALVPWIPGCGCVDWIAYVFAPASPMRTVEPEFAGLANKTVAVVIFAGAETRLEHGTVELELSDAVSTELRKRVKGVRTIDPRKIMRYQEENPRWDSMPPGRLCGVFNSDYVLLISVMEFSTRERRSMHLARGRIAAEAAIYDGDESGEALGGARWQTDMIRIEYPEKAPVGVPARDDWVVRGNTCRTYAVELVKRFYKHKVPKQP
jgi:hypothetical protein